MKIAAVNHMLPSRVISNDDVIATVRANSTELTAEQLDEVEKRIRCFLGIAGTTKRYWLNEGEKAIDLVVEAGRKSLREARLEPEDIDLIIYTGVGRGWLEPAMANVVQSELGLCNAVGFDVMDACESWLKGMQVAHSLLHTGAYHRAMIVNCEAGFEDLRTWNVRSVKDLDHLFASFTVGEAATATIVTDEEEFDDFYFTFKTFGQHFDLCMIPLPNFAHFMPKDYDERYVTGKFFSSSAELITRGLSLTIETFLKDPHLSNRKYDIAFGHSASVKANQVFARRVGLPLEKGFEIHQRFGNTVSASVPLALSVAIEEECIERGDRVLIGVPSAGISIGFAAFTF